LDASSAVSWADDADVVDVVVVGAVVALLWRPKINQEIPTTTTATTTMERTRRVPRLRLATFSSASRRAWRPAF